MTDAFKDQLRHGRDVFDADDAKVGTVAQEALGTRGQPVGASSSSCAGVTGWAGWAR
jgi:hypothetical protein